VAVSSLQMKLIFVLGFDVGQTSDGNQANVVDPSGV
jgi:hypothetical protein